MLPLESVSGVSRLPRSDDRFDRGQPGKSAPLLIFHSRNDSRRGVLRGLAIAAKIPASSGFTDDYVGSLSAMMRHVRHPIAGQQAGHPRIHRDCLRAARPCTEASTQIGKCCNWTRQRGLAGVLPVERIYPFASKRAQFFLREGPSTRTAARSQQETRFRHCWSRIFQRSLPSGAFLRSIPGSPQPVALPSSDRESKLEIRDKMLYPRDYLTT